MPEAMVTQDAATGNTMVVEVLNVFDPATGAEHQIEIIEATLDTSNGAEEVQVIEVVPDHSFDHHAANGEVHSAAPDSDPSHAGRGCCARSGFRP